MRSLKTGLFGIATVCLVGTFAVVGCTADGATEGDLGPGAAAGQDTDGTEPSETAKPGASLPEPGEPNGPAGDAGKKDGGKTDGGKSDGSTPPKDAGPPAPDEGAACTTPNEIFKRKCSLCGTQEAVCLAGENGAPNAVSVYGDCQGQIVNGCEPGATEDIPCGNCGTQKRTCNNYCAWTGAQCLNQPTNSCTPGSVELLSAGCSADKYRQKTCALDCNWGNVSASCSAPPTFVVVPPTVGSTNSTIAALTATKVTPRLPAYGTCPLTTSAFPTTSSSPPTPYTYIEVRNTNPKAVKVSIYNSQASGGPIIDTIMAAYDGTSTPTTDAARRTCLKGIGDSGTVALTGDSEFASLDDSSSFSQKAISIAAGGSVMVYFAAWDEYSASTPAKTTGLVKINVRTETIAP